MTVRCDASRICAGLASAVDAAPTKNVEATRAMIPSFMGASFVANGDLISLDAFGVPVVFFDSREHSQ